MLTVYKASAGSGKTFQLVAEYLALLLKNNLNYKHILAVTFTNKATAEMKSRILEQLYILATNQKSDYLPVIQENTQLTENAIRNKAKQVLKNILHDYNRFSVSTIDSFTQRVIKAFNRELGISPNFSIELDSGMVLEEAVDRLLAKIETDKKLRKWLINFSQEKINDNKNYKIEEDIKKLGKELFYESFQVIFPEDSEQIFSREKIKDFKSELEKIIKIFENTAKTKAKKALLLIENNGLTIIDFNRGNGGPAGFFKKISENNFENPTKTALDVLIDNDKWVAKNNKKRSELLPFAETNLHPLFVEIVNFFEENRREYISAKLVRNELRILGILTDLKKEIKLLLNEKGFLQISDSNLLLSKIIDNSDSPFVYEKLGNYYHHFMLDEFQDTSLLQWNNFKPLVINSLSEGNNNLVVGDVKQSIYRWRNSDWKILAEHINRDFSESSLTIKNLVTNWRSETNIIEFNNTVIDLLKNTFIHHLFAGNNAEMWRIMQQKVETIFSNFRQTPAKDNQIGNGWVNIQFFDEKTFETDSKSSITEQVKTLQDNGIRARDIAILIRKNDEGASIINTFLEAAKKEENKNYNLSILSNESLFLYASGAVLFIINLVETLINPENKIAKAAAFSIWMLELKPRIENMQAVSFSELISKLENGFEQELGARLAQINGKLIFNSIDESIAEICSTFGLFSLADQIPFIQCLIDKAGEIKSSVSNDFSNLLFWWNEKGYKTSVNVNEEIDAIRLLTIHKAKGLEFEAVILPKFDWTYDWSHTPTLWCKSDLKPFCNIPIFPVKALKNVEDSYFQNDFIEEKANTYIDNLNLVYVAFTRAKSALIIHAPKTEKATKKINSLLQISLENLAENESFKNCWNPEKLVFNFGKLKFKHKKEEKDNSKPLLNYYYSDFKKRINLRYSSDEFLHNDVEKSGKNMGKIIHDILSKVEKYDDIEKACNDASNRGLINEKEKLELLSMIPNQINNLKLETWFNGSLKILNERNLISPGHLFRPDRIMVKNKEAIVVDYKTGLVKSKSHVNQVVNYAKQLKSAGFTKVEGYLWYLTAEEIEKVCEL